MSERRRTYSAEFKREALRLLETSGKTATQIERELGIGDGCLIHWKKKLETRGSQAFPGHGRLPADREEWVRSRRELEIARQERDLLHEGGRLLLAPKKARFRFIDENRHRFPVVLACKLLAVSPSGYYAWRAAGRRTRGPAER